MRPVGGGACAAHITFPHTFHKASHAPHTSFTKLHTAQHTLTHLSHNPHKVFTNPSQFNPPLPSVAAALAPLLQPSSQRVHKGFTKHPLIPIKVTYRPYKAPSKVTRGRCGPAGRGFPDKVPKKSVPPPNPPVAKIQCWGISLSRSRVAACGPTGRGLILMVPQLPPVRFPIFSSNSNHFENQFLRWCRSLSAISSGVWFHLPF